MTEHDMLELQERGCDMLIVARHSTELQKNDSLQIKGKNLPSLNTA